MTHPTPHTSLARSDAASIHYRDQDLVESLLGHRSFVDVFYRQLLGTDATPAQLEILDAVLIALMEHGLTPSATAARLVYSSSPENIQAGVAAGLLAVGSQFVGTMDGCATVLEQVMGTEDTKAGAAGIVALYRAEHLPMPGFGHHIHRPDDPRAFRLLALAEERGTAGRYQETLRLVAAEVDRAAGKHITINATGAVAALLGDIGIPARLMRGVAVLSRAAGLVTHIAEEQKDPIDRYLWERMDELVPFADE